jgi:hypothetical protein
MNALRFKHLLVALTAVTALFVIALVAVVAQRVAFPYDYLIWSESPFLTNMLKLHNGAPIYGPLSDANSFVYAPGLEYLCQAILGPFGLALDVRACRIVNVAVGALAAITAALIMTRLTAAMTSATRPRGMAVLLAGLAILVLFKSFTADVCHPDNLHALHLMVSIALTQRALSRGDSRAALSAALWSGAGVIVKQTAALTTLGVVGCLVLLGARHFSARSRGLMALAGLGSAALSCSWLLLMHEHGAFWLYRVLRAHPVELSRLDQLFGQDISAPHRLVLYAALVPCTIAGLASKNEARRTFTQLWLATGVVGALPALAAYLKHLGLWNNLVVIDLWAMLLVVPTLIAVAQRHDLEHRHGLCAAALLSVIVLGSYPIKRPPSADHLRYGRAIEASLREDFARGDTVLVGHGTAALIRAGYRDVPRDRSNTLLELVAARRRTPKDTLERLSSGHYARIYASWPLFPGDADAIMRREYYTERDVPAPAFDDPSIATGCSPNVVAPVRILAWR